jgi:hypothetical protein
MPPSSESAERYGFGFDAQEARLSALRPPQEFFDYNRVSRPADFSQATSVRPPSRGDPRRQRRR